MNDKKRSKIGTLLLIVAIALSIMVIYKFGYNTGTWLHKLLN